MLKSYFIDGDKGGVGKSLFTRAFIHYYLSLPQEKRPGLLLVDADCSNPDVCGKGGFKATDTEPLPKEILWADLFDLSTEDGWIELGDQVGKTLNREPARELRMIVSLPAQIGTRAFDGSIIVVNELLHNTNAIPVWLLSRTLESLTALEYRCRAMPRRYAIGAAVKNLFFGEADRFDRWDGSALRKSLMREDGTAWIETTMPELNSTLTDQIARRPFHKVYAEGYDGEPLALGAKLALDAWFRTQAKSFAQIEALTPPADDVLDEE